MASESCWALAPDDRPAINPASADIWMKALVIMADLSIRPERPGSLATFVACVVYLPKLVDPGATCRRDCSILDGSKGVPSCGQAQKS
jgi:hypothetical protein